MILRQISQSHLTLLDYCPRKFQHVYLEQLSFPLSMQEQAALKRGSDLHHLMQQQELHLLPPVNPTPPSWSPETVKLYQMAHQLATVIPKPSESTRFRQSEYRLHYEIEGMLLTVVYDLLMLTDTHAYIVDWKTYSRPPQQAELATHWQTKLYPFVLAATSEYRPSDITLSYWFMQISGNSSGSSSGSPSGSPSDQPDQATDVTAIAPDLQPDCIRFEHSDRHQHQVHHDLIQTIRRLKQWLADYETGIALPQTDRIQERCPRCPFAFRCGRSHPSASDQWTDLDNIEAIAEIPLPDGSLKDEFLRNEWLKDKLPQDELPQDELPQDESLRLE
ncbi:MAG: PD-(D/E)XK nuclease family protein [Cyanothece sp. SIO2G6]|nr:PD-(D/E)XK nuclease family protein [Cyanothece sp. SIO2G6]